MSDGLEWGHDMSNDAGKYGVQIHHVVNPAWRVTNVHHLTPAENKGKHNVYVDAFDETGQRVSGVELWWGDSSGAMGKMNMDKPSGEPMCNIPIWRGQMIYVSMGDDSDSVVGLHSMHGDELGPNGEIWNSQGHHSFYVCFQKVGQAAKPTVCPCCGQELPR